MKIDASKPLPKEKPKFTYAAIPEALIRDPAVSDEAARLYGIFHTLAGKKEFLNRATGVWCFPVVIVSQARIKDVAGLSRWKIRRAQRILINEGWITVKRRGALPSLIILNPYKKKAGDEEKEKSN